MQLRLQFSETSDPVRAKANALIGALAHLGDGDAAESFLQRFEASGWRLSDSDLGALTAAIALAASRPAAVPGPAPSISSGPVAEVELDSIPDEFRAQAPFIKMIPGWRELLPAVQALLHASRWEVFRETTTRLFIDVLGYEARPENLAPRLRARSAIDELRQIGVYGNLRVCLVRLTRSLSDTRYSNYSAHYDTCFRLAPDAILLSYEPGAGAMRVVYRERVAGGRLVSKYRCIVGPWFLRDPNETLLTIMWRFRALAPRVTDQPRDLIMRPAQALASPVASFAREWPSTPFAGTGEAPGLAFHAVGSELTPEPCRLGQAWGGLERATRNLFPCPIKYGECWLDLIGVEPSTEPLPAGDCWRTARTREVVLTLTLAIRRWDDLTETARFSISAALALPDERGWFWIEGCPHRWVPVLAAHEPDLSRLAAQGATPDEDGVSAEPPAALSDEVVAIPEEEEDADDEGALAELEENGEEPATGADVSAALLGAVERRLWFLLRSTRRALHRSFDEATPGEVRAGLLSACGPGEAIPLLTGPMLRRMLRPVELAHATPQLVDAVVDLTEDRCQPPPWACPDLSACLQPGEWAVVSAARVHPTGALAVPFELGDGTWELRVSDLSALAVNPRINPIAAAWASWWTHPRLAHVASVPIGLLLDSARFAARSEPIGGRGFATQAVISASLSPNRLPKRELLRSHLDLPPDSEAPLSPPTVLAGAGAVLRAGQPWVRVRAASFSEQPERSRSVLSRLHPDLDPGGLEDRVTFVLPWDLDALVLAVGATPIRRFEALVGWRVWIEAVEVEPKPGALLGRHGQLHELAARWTQEDAPFEADGDTPDYLVPEGDGTDVLFSGTTGELVVGSWTSGTVWVGTSPVQTRARGRGLIDRLPRCEVPTAGERWSLLRLRIVAGRAGDGWPECLSEMEGHHALVARAARIRDHDPDAETEVFRAPLITQVHLAGRELTGEASGIRCRCGRLGGVALLGALCSRCAERVLARPIPIDGKCIKLPTELVHPWSREVLAALLGLLPDELGSLIILHGPTAALAAADGALSDPSAAALRRLGLPATHPRVIKDARHRSALAQMAGLMCMMEPHALCRMLRLRSIGLLPYSLLGVGSVPGQAQPAGSRLLAHYSEIHAACWTYARAQGQGMPIMDAAAGAQLQAAVDELFGSPDDDTVDTLAGLLAHTNPWRRPALPPVFTPPSPTPPASAGDAAWWSRRAARHAVIERWAIMLVAIVSTVPGWTPIECEAATRDLADAIVAEEAELGPLLAVLTPARASGVRLPTEIASAKTRLSAALDWLPSEAAREALLRCLLGWWLGPPSVEHPSGMIWLPPESAGPSGWSRRLLSLEHPAWRLWDGVVSMLPHLGLARVVTRDAPLLLPLAAILNEDAGDDTADFTVDETLGAGAGRQTTFGDRRSASISEGAERVEDTADAPTDPGTPRRALEIVVMHEEVWKWLRA